MHISMHRLAFPEATKSKVRLLITVVFEASWLGKIKLNTGHETTISKDLFSLWYMPFQINIDLLKVLSGLEERKNRRAMILGFTLTTRWLVIVFINRIRQVVRFHKMALSGRPFMEERLLELVKWLFGCRCIHHPRQYVRFDVISSRVVHDFQTIVRGLSLQYKNCSFFNNGCETCRTLISDECLQWSPFQLRKTF